MDTLWGLFLPVLTLMTSAQRIQHLPVHILPPSLPARFPPLLRVEGGFAPNVFSNNHVANDNARRKTTLKDIVVQDCPLQAEHGYCDKPPRYPANQVEVIIQQCGQLVDLLYVPLPADEESGNTVTDEKPTSIALERANQQTWSWLRYEAEKVKTCFSDRQQIAPGFVRDNNTQQWLVVLQSARHNITQQLSTDRCQAISQHCAQRWSYKHLITWNPDLPQHCPKLRAFRFPTACLCTQ